MDQTSAYAVEALNGLIATAVDSADGYEKAQDLARNPRVAALFRSRGEARRRLVEALALLVRDLGGEPGDGGSLIGPAHRLLLTLRDKAAGDSDRPLVEEVERGEDFLHGRLANAAQDPGLPPGAREALARESAEVAAEHAELTALREQFQ